MWKCSRVLKNINEFEITWTAKFEHRAIIKHNFFFDWVSSATENETTLIYTYAIKSDVKI